MSTRRSLRSTEPLFDASPAGLVAVTSDSLIIGESHGSFALDSSALIYFQLDPPDPGARVPDRGHGGCRNPRHLPTWTRSPAPVMTWDTDVVSPGHSGNIVARIPGEIRRRRRFSRPTWIRRTVRERSTTVRGRPPFSRSRGCSTAAGRCLRLTSTWCGSVATRRASSARPTSPPPTRSCSTGPSR